MSYRRRKVRWFRLSLFVLGLPAILAGAFGFGYWNSRDRAPTAAPAREVSALPETAVKQEFQLISIYAQNDTIHEVVARIERKTGRTIIMGPRIREKVTVELEAVPWPEALKTVVELAGCELTRDPDGSFRVNQEPRVTIFRDGTSLREALRQLAAKRGYDILIPEEIQGPLTIDLIAVSWDEALSRLLKESGPYTTETDSAGRLVVTRIPGR